MTRDLERTPSASRTTMTTIVLPADTNNYGHVFGGRILALSDKVAAMTAVRHCRLPVVTASIDRVDFLHPIKSGMFADFVGEITAAFRTSMEIAVTVEAEDPISGTKILACRALLTIVAIDASGRPVPVPKVDFEDDEQRARAVRAEERRRQRLATRDGI